VTGNDFFLSTKIFEVPGGGEKSYPSFYELILGEYFLFTNQNYSGERVGQRRTVAMLSIQSVQ
jgi:hypothetical protein